MRFRTAPPPIRFNWGAGLRALMSRWRRPLRPMFLRSANRLLQVPFEASSSFFNLLPPRHPIRRRVRAGCHRPCSSAYRRWPSRERLIICLRNLEGISAPDAAATEGEAGEAAAEEGEEGSRWRAGPRRSRWLFSSASHLPGVARQVSPRIRMWFEIMRRNHSNNSNSGATMPE